MIYRAHLMQDQADFQLETVRLLVIRERFDNAQDVLMEDGLWQTVPAGATADGPVGVILPVESVDAVARAIESWRGASSHAATEAAVLREWLAVEQARVDHALGRET